MRYRNFRASPASGKESTVTPSLLSQRMIRLLRDTHEDVGVMWKLNLYARSTRSIGKVWLRPSRASQGRARWAY